MKPFHHSFLLVVAGLGAVGALAVALASAHQTRLRLTEEQRHLQDQLTALSARNQALSNLLARPGASPAAAEETPLELLRLRGEVSVLRRQTQELAGAQSPAPAGGPGARSGTNAATADYWPQGAWSFAGYASPDASLQTSLWAALHGDLQALAASATGEMLKEIEDEFRDKSEAENKARALDHVLGFQSVRILNREEQPDGSVVLTTAIEDRNSTETVKMRMRKVGEQWKLAGPAD